MTSLTPAKTKLVVSFSLRMFFFLLIWLAVFFLPAGDFAYWQAWVVLAILFIPMAASFVYWLKNDPDLLERRMKTGETQAEQKPIMRAFSILFIFTFLLPGLDYRLAWSHVPTALSLIADGLVMLGFGICLRVIAENRYASRTVEVAQGQRVISSGLYAVVRHPMYMGVLLMCAALPLALGSYWALIPALLIVPILAARIKNEESVLLGELEGYGEYLQKTKYRLFPGGW
ncbi:MAG: isoprenylcysteine carboxylmethyltransferase family protein [Chloroflexi bacterium]|nr:isoprenylcysteine carboxylmethyltransferase family protein [Chloroflexota bacterium]